MSIVRTFTVSLSMSIASTVTTIFRRVPATRQAPVPASRSQCLRPRMQPVWTRLAAFPNSHEFVELGHERRARFRRREDVGVIHVQRDQLFRVVDCTDLPVNRDHPSPNRRRRGQWGERLTAADMEKCRFYNWFTEGFDTPTSSTPERSSTSSWDRRRCSVRSATMTTPPTRCSA